jgi:hypothetical protein
VALKRVLLAYNNVGGFVQVSLMRQLSEIAEALEATQGEVTPAIEARFDSIIAKVDSCALFRDYGNNQVEFLKSKADEFKKAAESVQKTVENFERYLLLCLKNSGQESFQGKSFTVGTKKNPPSLIIDDLNLIPPEFFTRREVVELEKSKLKDAFKVQPIPGAHIEHKTSLSIKPRKI